MEGRNRCLEFGFPGYDGCFPKATRSSRGRGDGMKKSNDQHTDMHSFELLATVAGELLQEEKDEGMRDQKNLEDPENVNVKTDINKEIKCTETSPADSGEHKQLGNTGISIIGKLPQDMGVRGLHTSILPKAEVLHEYSVISCLDDPPDFLIPHGFDSRPTATYSSRRRRNSEASSCNKKGSPTSLVPFCAMLIKPDPGKILTNHFSATFNAESATGMSLHGSTEGNTTAFDRKDEERHIQSAAIRRCEDIDMIIQNAFHVVDAESPPLLSSGSSEETPLLDPNYDLAIAVESRRQDAGGYNLFSPKGGFEDGNCSESTIKKYMHTKPSNASFKTQKPRRPANNGVKNQESATAVKRKRRRADGAGKDEKQSRGVSDARAARQAGKVLLDNREEHRSNIRSLDVAVDAENDAKLLASPKDNKKDSEKIASSPTRSSPPKSTAKKAGDHVKFSIKSFMVPELLLELPESATVANLKQVVMDSAMNLLGGGLCVRVLLQGKKVADESQSLLHAGLATGGQLGFLLEPNKMYPTTSLDDGFLVLSHGNKQTSLRYPVQSKGTEANAGTLHEGSTEEILEVDANNLGTETKPITMSPSKQEVVMYDTNGMVVPTSSALILHPSQVKNDGLNGLAVVPFEQNAVNKRRMRRPFSVTEVEVLVEAVEKLGTGRWRDVKLHAFPQAKHRTYVDLKDKWKTLVHTASIAPHQRRGEPVPQALLDRVIRAHSYWTEQQAKQQTVENKIVVTL